MVELKVIDTHAHFWNVEELRYPWIDPGSPFDRSFSLQDYQRAAADVPVARMVFVECDAHSGCTLREAQWVSGLAAIDDRLQGIVGRVPLTDNDKVLANLDAMAALPLVKGIRDNIQNHPPGFAIQSDFVGGVREVHRRGLHFELCLRHHQLAETIELVKRCSEGRFVLDHCAKPDIQAGSREPWLAQIRELAAMPHVVCKISGLVTEADWERWTPEEVLWYARSAAEVFGPSRILFGSDWPINEVAGGYLRWFRLAEELAAPWSQVNQERFFWQNAEEVYRLSATQG